MVKLLTTRKIKNMGIVCTILLAKQLGRRNGMPRATFCGDSLESDGSATWPDGKLNKPNCFCRAN